MFEIRYYNDCNDQYVVIATCATIGEARALRQVSGDLVVDADTNIIVSDSRWLWEWERLRPSAYAYQQLGKHRPGQRIRR